MIAAGKATSGVIITVEDHYAVGGLGDAVSEAVAPAGLAVRRLAVREIPRSGPPDELLDRYGISREAHRRRRPHVRLRPARVQDCDRRRPRHAGADLSSSRPRRSRAAARRARAGVVARRQAAGVRLPRSDLALAPDGKNGKALRPEATDIERDPAWSPDGQSIVFAADTGQGFDIVVSPTNGGAVRRVTTMPGDERWPSWTSDGRVVFSHRDRRPMALCSGCVDAAGGEPKPALPRHRRGTTSSRAAYRLTASASRSCPIATATTTIEICGSPSSHQARAIA